MRVTQFAGRREGKGSPFERRGGKALLHLRGGGRGEQIAPFERRRGDRG